MPIRHPFAKPRPWRRALALILGLLAALTLGVAWRVQAAPLEQAPSPAAETPEGIGRLTGKISNGTPGGGDVTGLTALLNTFDQSTALATQEVQVDVDGGFVFEGLPTDPNNSYVVTTEYRGHTFGSELGAFEPGQSELQLPVVVYEASEQPGEITAPLAQWFIDTHQGALLIGELYRIVHEGDHLYVGSEQVAPGKRAVLTFGLPPEATSLTLEGGEVGGRFVRTAEGVVDTAPLAPGGRQILLRYLLPYRGTKAELAHSLAYPAAKLNVLVAEGPRVQTDLAYLGPQTVSGQQWANYGADDVPAGERISLRLSDLDRADAATTAPTSGASSSVLAFHPSLLYGLAALAIIAVLVALIAALVRSNPLPAAPATSTAVDLAGERQRLLQAIARLDDSYAAGRMDERTYRSRRSAQKRSVLLITRQLEGDSQVGAQPQGDDPPQELGSAQP